MIRSRILSVICIVVFLLAMASIAGCTTGGKGNAPATTLSTNPSRSPASWTPPTPPDALPPGFPREFWGYCTWYAATEFYKVAPTPKPGVWTGDAKDWFTNDEANKWKKTQEPGEALPGSMMVWGGTEFGHVAVVRNVSDSTITLDEMNWGPSTGIDDYTKQGITSNFGVITPKTLPKGSLDREGGLKFLGFILPIPST